MPFTPPQAALTLPPPVQLPQNVSPQLMQPAQQSKPPDLASALAKGGGGGQQQSSSTLDGGSLGGNQGAKSAGGALDQSKADKGITSKTQTGDQWQQAVGKQNAEWAARPHDATKALDQELRSEDQRRMEDERLTQQQSVPDVGGVLDQAISAGFNEGATTTDIPGLEGYEGFEDDGQDDGGGDWFGGNLDDGEGGGEPADDEWGQYGWD